MGRQIRFGAFTFDPGTGSLNKNGTPVPLQSQPARVLALLTARPGESFGPAGLAPSNPAMAAFDPAMAACDPAISACDPADRVSRRDGTVGPQRHLRRQLFEPYSGANNDLGRIADE